MTKPNVLIIDDESDVRELVRDVVEGCGCTGIGLEDPAQAAVSVKDLNPDLVLLDLQMPGVDGIETLRALSETGANAKVILVSGMDPRVLRTAQNVGRSLGMPMVGTLHKPFEVEELETMVRRSLEEISDPSPAELRTAIESGELLMYYQPKVTLRPERAGSTVEVEALVRWQHPRLGLVMPDSFIPIAEADSSLMAGLTDYVVRASASQLATWLNSGMELSLAINIAASDLDDLAFPENLVEKVSKAGIDPARVSLEVTETGAMNDLARTMDVLTRLRLKGFALCIDDFGTGYSSLLQLHRMPFGEIKIDKSFVMAVEKDEEAQLIVRTVILLAHNLSLTACAEGVDSEYAWRLLEDVRCDKAQGYYISPPLPAHELPGWLERNRYPQR